MKGTAYYVGYFFVVSVLIVVLFGLMMAPLAIAEALFGDAGVGCMAVAYIGGLLGGLATVIKYIDDARYGK